jgi:hypothetical protein
LCCASITRTNPRAPHEGGGAFLPFPAASASIGADRGGGREKCTRARLLVSPPLACAQNTPATKNFVVTETPGLSRLAATGRPSDPLSYQMASSESVFGKFANPSTGGIAEDLSDRQLGG